jgi:hypothetical protein
MVKIFNLDDSELFDDFEQFDFEQSKIAKNDETTTSSSQTSASDLLSTLQNDKSDQIEPKVQGD